MTEENPFPGTSFQSSSNPLW